MDAKLYDGHLGIEFSKEVPPPDFSAFRLRSAKVLENPRATQAMRNRQGGGWILGEVRDGHGRGGRISEHEKRREGRGWHGAFGFGACGTAAAPRFGNAGWISGVRRRRSGARSDPKTGLGGRSAPTAPSRTQSARPEFCMNNPCSTVVVQRQRNIRERVCSPKVARFRRICIVVRGSRYAYTALPRPPCICAKLARCKNQGAEIRFECAKPR